MEDDEIDLNKIIEAMASVFHIAWEEWSKELANSEQLSEKRMIRWEKYWVPYNQLPEEVKEQDRKFARVAFVMLGLALPPIKKNNDKKEDE